MLALTAKASAMMPSDARQQSGDESRLPGRCRVPGLNGAALYQDQAVPSAMRERMRADVGSLSPVGPRPGASDTGPACGRACPYRVERWQGLRERTAALGATGATRRATLDPWNHCAQRARNDIRRCSLAFIGGICFHCSFPWARSSPSAGASARGTPGCAIARNASLKIGNAYIQRGAC